MVSNSLEQERNIVPPDDINASMAGLYEVSRCGCGSWFCGCCSENKGYALRRRLVPAIDGWEAMQVWTLTVDPLLFATPRDALIHVRDTRALARLVDRLHRCGALSSRRWFWVIEWHKSGWPHWHLLVEADFIPYAAVMREWDKFRPADAGPVEPNRPAFGFVWLSKKAFASPLHAARYATKYLVKMPEAGFPEWVLAEREIQIRRYGSSRGLWGTPPREVASPDPDRTRESLGLTYGEKVASCGEAVNMFKVLPVCPMTGEADRRIWLGTLNVPARYLNRIDDGDDPRRRRRRLACRSWDELYNFFLYLTDEPPTWLAARPGPVPRSPINEGWNNGIPVSRADSESDRHVCTATSGLDSGRPGSRGGYWSGGSPPVEPDALCLPF